jgi:hypothetical protein
MPQDAKQTQHDRLLTSEQRGLPAHACLLLVVLQANGLCSSALGSKSRLDCGLILAFTSMYWTWPEVYLKALVEASRKCSRCLVIWISVPRRYLIIAHVLRGVFRISPYSVLWPPKAPPVALTCALRPIKCIRCNLRPQECPGAIRQYPVTSEGKSELAISKVLWTCIVVWHECLPRRTSTLESPTTS